jgi:hypothetical protein
LQALFDAEAKKNNVYPLDDRFAERAVVPDRPSVTACRTTFVYYPGTVRVPEGSTPNVKARSHRITAAFEVRGNRAQGVIVAAGGSAGYSLFVKDERLMYEKELAMKASAIVSFAGALATAGAAYAQTTPQVPYTARAFNPAHADLARSAGVPARLANEAYVEALARIVYYWGYPAVDQLGRTGMWEMLKSGPGLMFGILPGGPMNTSACLTDYLPPSQRFVVTPNNDTFYGIGFANLGQEPAVIQTPTNAPQGHYWTVQIVDAFSNVIHQIGSASRTPGGKFLLVGPDWTGQKPDGFLDILRVPTHYAGAFGRSFAARTPEAKARALAVLNQLGMYPLSKNQAGRHNRLRIRGAQQVLSARCDR